MQNWEKNRTGLTSVTEPTYNSALTPELKANNSNPSVCLVASQGNVKNPKINRVVSLPLDNVDN